MLYKQCWMTYNFNKEPTMWAASSSLVWLLQSSAVQNMYCTAYTIAASKIKGRSVN